MFFRHLAWWLCSLMIVQPIIVAIIINLRAGFTYLTVVAESYKVNNKPGHDVNHCDNAIVRCSPPLLPTAHPHGGVVDALQLLDGAAIARVLQKSAVGLRIPITRHLCITKTMKLYIFFNMITAPRHLCITKTMKLYRYFEHDHCPLHLHSI